MLLLEFLTKVKGILLCQLNLSIYQFIYVLCRNFKSHRDSVMSLIIKLNVKMTLFIFQGSGLQVAEMQPAIRLLPRQPAVMFCKALLRGRAWNNLLRGNAWAQWFKHVLVASELSVGLQGSPQHTAASQSLLLPGTCSHSSLTQIETRDTGLTWGQSCTLLEIPEKCFQDPD